MDSASDEYEDEPKTKYSKRMQKYRKEWEHCNEFSGWLKPVAGNNSRASCQACRAEMLADISVIRNHSKASKHKKLVQSLCTQPKLTTFQKKHEESDAVKRAEIKLCGLLAEHNLPMRLMDHLTPLLKDIFPDSKIAQELALGRTKATSIIKHVIGSHSRDMLVEQLKANKFSFLIDESTDVGSIKNICVCVRFFDNNENKICTKFFDLISCYKDSDAEEANIGMTAENIYNKIIDCFTKRNIPLENIVGFGSDGCNTMFGNQNSVVSRLKTNLPGILVQKCVCHSLHLCASEACKVLPRQCEDMARNVYSFFNCSSKRQAQLAEFQHFCNVEPHKILAPSQTRWLSLLMVVNRIVEQWDPLLLYFTNNVLKHRLQSSEFILSNLKDVKIRLFFYFLQWVLPKFVHLNEYFQSERVVLTNVFNKFKETYKELLLTYLNSQYVHRTNLNDINPEYYEQFIDFNNIYLGINVLNNIHKLSETEKKDFYYRCRQFLIVSCCEIKKRFDFDENNYLNQVSIFDINTVQYKNIPTLLPIMKLFPRVVNLNNIQEMQEIDDEWRLLRQTELPEFIKSEVEIDKFWHKMGNITDYAGAFKFKAVSKFVLNVLVAPHSNASCERVFSKINLIKTDLRNKLCNETVNGLILSSQLMNNNCCGFEPPKSMYKLMTKEMYSHKKTDDVEYNIQFHNI